MRNVTRITHRDVQAIVALRDEGNTWEYISAKTGYCMDTCRNHYNLAKSESVFYFSQFLEEVKKKKPEFMTSKDAFLLAKSMGYVGTFATFREREDIKNIPFFKSQAMKRNRIKQIKNTLRINPSSSLRELVWELFHDYSRGGKYQIYYELLESNDDK